MNNSRMSQPTSPQLTVPKMNTRSTEGSGEQRTPSALNAGAACRITPANQGTSTTLLQQFGHAFAAVVHREYRMLIGAITEAALLAQQLSPNPQIQRLQYLIQRVLVQLDGQHPVPSTRNQPSRSEHHGDTTLVRRTPRGGLGSRRNDNCQRNKGHLSVCGNNKQEVQQPTHN
jgi:hypothetical protein